MNSQSVIGRLDFDLSEARAVLERTPATLDAMLRGLPAAWSQARDGAETWSPHEVIAHLISADRTDWIARAAVILERNPSALFPPFDRVGFFEEAKTMALGDLLDLFARVRAESLATLDGWRLSDETLDLVAQHPEFGSVTLRQLLSTWVAHDLGHIVQVARTMARQYKAAVGPWAAYLSVMPT
jgi:uncharacterized damage-inducible protein DinB